jgi:AAA+ ATPase superfamily predicted ATPase
MDLPIIGREEEIAILQRLKKSNFPELLAIYGRRRVGKTYLIKTFFASNMIFECSGQSNATKEVQLINFVRRLNKIFHPSEPLTQPRSWQEAFAQLQDCLESIKGTDKKVLFFDELPWLDSHKSGFLSAFGYFWNIYASERSDLLIVICGSAASWMIKKVVNNKGGLHNRITQRIRLLPFTLKGTEDYLRYRNISFDHYQLLQLYMAIGGVPHYLNAIERGRSVQQNIEKLCFSKDGLLADEFSNLYSALFSYPERHIQIIRALSKKSTGGTLTNVLDELTESGFIEKMYPFSNANKESLYRLTDEFSLFYFRFIHNKRDYEDGTWLAQITTPAYLSWCGYAFENVCLRHIPKIKKALGISGVLSSQSSWYKSGDKDSKGAQIDLLIDRNDRCVNVCEMKFSASPFVIEKKYAASLRERLMLFRQETKIHKALFQTFVTTFGVADNEYKTQVVDCEVTMEDFFA